MVFVLKRLDVDFSAVAIEAVGNQGEETESSSGDVRGAVLRLDRLRAAGLVVEELCMVFAFVKVD